MIEEYAANRREVSIETRYAEEAIAPGELSSA